MYTYNLINAYALNPWAYSPQALVVYQSKLLSWIQIQHFVNS